MDLEEYGKILIESQSDLKVPFPPRYLASCPIALKQMFTIAKELLRVIRKDGTKRRGLDVGCAHGSLTVLAPGYKLEVVGLDINFRPVYVSTQTKLQEMGYPIVMYSELPLSMFKNDEFDFIVMRKSKCKRMLDQDRIAELARILKNSGIWYIGPRAHLRKRKPLIKSQEKSLKKAFSIKSINA